MTGVQTCALPIYVVRQFSGSAGSGGGEDSVGAGELAALKAELTRQGDELMELRNLVNHLAKELGIEIAVQNSLTLRK